MHVDTLLVCDHHVMGRSKGYIHETALAMRNGTSLFRCFETVGNKINADRPSRFPCVEPAVIVVRAMSAAYRWLLPYSVPFEGCVINPRASGDIQATRMRMCEGPPYRNYSRICSLKCLPGVLDAIFLYDRKVAIHGGWPVLTIGSYMYMNTLTLIHHNAAELYNLYYTTEGCVGGRSPWHTTHIG